jgi:4-amino-4-deoxy-L-arabinose transferase-like glycosyltransferase
MSIGSRWSGSPPDSADTPPFADDRAAGPRCGPGRTRVAWVGLAGSTALALALNCWQLSLNGLGNTYYSAAVRAMTSSWRNFFFAAFDKGGFISVDKPPVMLWVTALSAHIFGYSTWSLLLPAALVGAAAVSLLWIIVERWFGPLAATLAALVLAASPISVAVNRLDLPEPYLVFFLLGAVWALQRSLDDERWLRWTILAAGFVGLAFNTKMLAAAIPGPALALLVAFGVRETLRRRVLRLVVFGMASLVFSASWLLVVDAVPASSRPYVGGSTDNTVLDLVVGYNGLGRVDGGAQGGGTQGVASRAGGTFGAAGGVFGGAPGPGRLFSDALGGQIAWFVPLALGGAALALYEHRRHWRRRAAIGMWLGWFGLHTVVFSYAKGTFHAYYTAMLAPSVAALVGIGGGAILALIRRDARWWSAAGALLAVSAALHVDLMGREPTFHAWTRVALAVATVASVAVAALAVRSRPRAREASLSIAFAALLITPLAWSVSESNNAVLNATLPQAGPRTGVAGSTFGSTAFDANLAIAAFLRGQAASTRWDMVTANAQIASGYSATYDLSVMALGGFMGTDPAATVASFGALVRAGEVRYVLLDTTGTGARTGTNGTGFGGLGAGGASGFAGGPTARGPAGPPSTGANGRAGTGAGTAGAANRPRGFSTGTTAGTASQILAAVRQVCAPVTSASTNGALPANLNNRLYDCTGVGEALAAWG